MKEILIISILTGVFFLIFLTTLILGLVKKSKQLKWISLFVLILFCGLIICTGIKITQKSLNKVSEIFKPRTGYEIYEALFGKRQADCITILNYQDQTFPVIDYAIYLHFETCPQEVKRIVSKHAFTIETLPANEWNGKIPSGETLDWFNPTTLGDTILVYEYISNNGTNIQTLWVNPDSTSVFVRDISD